MTAGFPVKADYVAGDILTATNMDDLAGTVNLLNPTAKGGLVSASAANTPSTLSVGANNTILVADSAATPGIKWTSTLTTPTIDVINAASASGTTQSLFPNTTTGTVNVATGLTSGSLKLGNSLSVSGATDQTIASSNGITIKTNDGSTGGTISIYAGGSPTASGGGTVTLYGGSSATGGNLSIDAGFGITTKGTISIGATNASKITLSASAVVTQTNGYRTTIQPTPSAQNATATVTLANLLTEIITSNSTTAVALTLPTGTTMNGAPFATFVTNQAFDWSIINTGSSAGAVTLTANTAHTIVGNAVVAISTSARWRSVNTASNTWITYRIS